MFGGVGATCEELTPMTKPRMTPDRSDPDVRATARLRRLRMRDEGWRVCAVVALCGLAVVCVLTAQPVTGESGATLGALLGAGLLGAVARVVWPWTWSGEERRHRALESIWRQVRTDARVSTDWDRYAAWAAQAGERVELQLLQCAPSGSDAPSPYGCAPQRVFEPDDIEAAAAGMEALRARAVELELRSRERSRQVVLDAERAAEDAALEQVDREAAADLATREAQLRREFATQEAAERRVQAEALARALRRG